MENCTVSRVSFRFGVEDRVTFRISNVQPNKINGE